MKDLCRIRYTQTKGFMMKKYALFYGIIGTLLWLFALVYLLIGFKDLAKDSHKTATETHSSLAPFHKAKACIKIQCQTHNLQEDTRYTLPFFYRLTPDE